MGSNAFTRYHKYVVDAINRIDECLDRAAVYAGHSPFLMEATGISCRRLEWLQVDPDFQKDVEQIYLTPPYQGVHLASLQQFSDDFEEFLQLEREILLRGGVSPTTVERLIAQCHVVIGAMPAHEGDSNQVMVAINQLQAQTCGLAQELQQEFQDEQRGEQVKRTLRKVAIGLGGAAIIGLNFTALAATVGLSAVGSTLSGELGIALIAGSVLG